MRSRVFAPIRNGAYPVASALGAEPGTTPVRLCEHTMEVEVDPQKQELSTLVGLGTFYFGPTVERISLSYRAG